MTESALGPPTAIRPHIRKVTIVLLAVGWGTGALITLLGAFDIRHFAGTTSAFALGYPVALLVHFLVGSFVVGGVLDLPNPSGLFGAVGRTVMSVVTVALVVGVVAADRWILDLLQATDQRGVYLTVSVLGALSGGLLSFFIFSTKRLRKGNRQFGTIQGGAALSGFAVGALSVVIVVIGLSVIRYRTLPRATIGPTDVHGIGGEYVALGDSYSAGEGIRPFDPHSGSVDDDGDDCHRSAQAYSRWLRFDGPIPPMRFAACSGAVSRDVYHAFDKARSDGTMVTVEPQVEQETTDPPTPHPEVGLVTLTMGGNDVLFSKIVVHCLEHDECMSATFEPPPEQGPPAAVAEDDVEQAAAESAAKVTFPPAQPLSTWAPEALETVSERMAALYPRLEASYPRARIVVIGYPQLFPDTRPGLIPDDCASLLRRFSEEERGQLRDLTTDFNNLLYERAVQAGIEFVSPAAIWDGHEPCGGKGQYTNSVKLLLAPNVVDGGSFHPNANGQHALASLLACYLDTNPVAPDPYVDHRAREVVLDGLVAPRQLGLVDAPGSMDAPLHCDGVH